MTEDISQDSGDTASKATHKVRGMGVAWLAIMLALVALLAAGYSAWQGVGLQRSSGTQSENASRVQNLGAELGRRLDELERGAAERNQTLSDIELALEQSREGWSSVSGRVDQLEAQVRAIPGITDSSRIDFLRTEAIYYMRIANAQALLAREPQVAADALQLADEKLRDIGDPRLTKVRAQLSNELAALRSMPTVDRAGISFKLQALAREVIKWPFRNQTPSRVESKKPDFFEGSREEAGPWARVKAVFAEVFSSIVSVREIDVAPELALGSAEQAIVIESIRVELQLARLGIISGNDGLFTQALQRVVDEMRRYFDTDASAVTAAFATLEQLVATEMPGAVPDVSLSLQMMLADASDNAVSDPRRMENGP